MKKDHRLLLTVLILSLVPFTLTGCRLFPKEDVETVPALVQPPSEQLVTHTIVEGPISEEITGFAQVGSGQEEQLYFPVSGRLQELRVKSGDDIQKGQIIAILETGDLNFALRRAKAALEQETLRYELRFGDDPENKFTDPREKRIAQLGVQCAQIEYDRLLKQQANSVIRAPFSGRITTLSAERGRMIEAFAPVTTLSNMKGLEMTSDLKSEDVKRVKAGTRVKVEMDGSEYRWGRVIAIDRITSDDTQRWVARIRMDDKSFPMKWDDSFNITFCLRSVSKALLVPNDAVREDVNGRKYLRIAEGKRRREAYVRIGIQNDTQTQILEGAKAGMVVIGK